MAATAPARAPPPSISPSPIGASSRAARLRRRKSRSAWNPRSLHRRGAGTRACRVETRLDTLSGPLPMKYLLILLGGGAGSLARYVAGSAITSRFGARFAAGPVVVNVTGCFLIGLTITLLTERLQ